MKTSNHQSAERFETVKRIFYTVQVMALGVFLSFLFVFGISYNPSPEKSEAEKPAAVSGQAYNQQPALHTHTILSTDKNS